MIYADDTALAESEETLKYILHVVAEESKDKGQKLSIAKTESMEIIKGSKTGPCSFERNGKTEKLVNITNISASR